MNDVPSAYIIGQSNAVMRDGFARKMQDSGVVNIVSIKALGSTASLLANFFIKEMPAGSADYCILDLSVYDRYLVFMSYYTLDDIDRYLSAAVAELRRRRIEPVFALIPPERNEETHAVRRKHIEIAERLGCLCFDGLEWLRKRSAEWGTAYDDAFADVNHLNPPAQALFAADLANWIAAVFATRGGRKLGEPPDACVVEVIPIAAASQGVVVHHAASSVIALDMVVVERGRPIDVHVGACARLCGLMVDSKNCSAKLQVTGSGTIVKSLVFYEELDRLVFIARIIPFTGNVADRDGRVTLAIAPDDAVVTEPTPGVIDASGASGAVLVSHLLVERRRPDRS